MQSVHFPHFMHSAARRFKRCVEQTLGACWCGACQARGTFCRAFITAPTGARSAGCQAAASVQVARRQLPQHGAAPGAKPAPICGLQARKAIPWAFPFLSYAPRAPHHGFAGGQHEPARLDFLCAHGKRRCVRCLQKTSKKKRSRQLPSSTVSAALALDTALPCPHCSCRGRAPVY